MSLALLVNPAKRGRGGRFVKSSNRKRPRRKTASSRTTKRKRRSRSAPVVHLSSSRRYRRNPARRAGRFSFADTIFPVAIGAGGALATDLAMGYLPLPVTLKTGMMRPVVKGGVAVGLGLLAGMLTKNKQLGAKVMAGALTVVAYSEVKTFLQTSMPALPLSGVGEYPMIEYAGSGMGAVDEFGMPTDTSMAGLVDDDLGEVINDSMGAVLDVDPLQGYGSPEF